MSWTLHYSLAAPINIVKAIVLTNFGLMRRTKVREVDDHQIEVRSTVHILFAKHPLGFISKASIEFIPVQEEMTDVHVTIYPAPLQGFTILFPVFFILIMLALGHWMAQFSFQELYSALRMIFLCVCLGSILIYILLKQTIISFFNNMIKEVQSLL